MINETWETLLELLKNLFGAQETNEIGLLWEMGDWPSKQN